MGVVVVDNMLSSDMRTHLCQLMLSTGVYEVRRQHVISVSCP